MSNVKIALRTRFRSIHQHGHRFIETSPFVRNRIVGEFDALRQHGNVVRRVMRAMVTQAQTCADRHGGHVEGHGDDYGPSTLFKVE
mgnify:CR=1 FL=1